MFFGELTCVLSVPPPSGLAAPVHSGLDGPLHVAERQRPGQLLHPLPDGSGGPAGHGPAGLQLPLLVGHWGQGQRCRGLIPLPHPLPCSGRHMSAMGPGPCAVIAGVVLSPPQMQLEDTFLLLVFLSTNGRDQRVCDVEELLWWAETSG